MPFRHANHIAAVRLWLSGSWQRPDHALHAKLPKTNNHQVNMQAFKCASFRQYSVAACDTSSAEQKHVIFLYKFDNNTSECRRLWKQVTWITTALEFSSLSCFRRSRSLLLRSRICSRVSDPLLFPLKSTRLLLPTLPVNMLIASKGHLLDYGNL